MEFVYNDGGRNAAGFKGATGDCVVRAIAIATEKPYREVYGSINLLARDERPRGKRRSVARNGVQRSTYHRYLTSLGWIWTPTMRIGSGCKVHLTDGELPRGRLIVRVSKHITTVIDGVIHDTHNPQRGATIWYRQDTPTGQPAQISHVSPDRCVYGYYRRGTESRKPARS